MAGTCTLVAVAEGAPAPLVAAASFRVDRREFERDDAAPWTAAYESLDHDGGVRQIDACFLAHGDKYRRGFCSPSSARVNIGPP